MRQRPELGQCRIGKGFDRNLIGRDRFETVDREDVVDRACLEHDVNAICQGRKLKERDEREIELEVFSSPG